jgi:predicted nucleic acid-binding protein
MVLADTSVWIDHLRKGDAALARLLQLQQILIHPFVVGEVALGNLKNRTVVIDSLLNLPIATIASDEEVLNFITGHKLSGTGIGYLDAHLLASVKLSGGAKLWTRDKRLGTAATTLGLGMQEKS